MTRVHPPPNWFADGQHLLQLAGGTIAVGVQAATAWAAISGKRDTRRLKNIVTAGDEIIVKEISNVESSIGKLRALLGDRRKSPDAKAPTWAGTGRRASDLPATPSGE